MDILDDLRIYKDDPGMDTCCIFTRDIANGIIMSFPKEFFEWREPEYEDTAEWTDGWLTLKDVSNQIVGKLGKLPGVVFVWYERPREGAIYRFGSSPSNPQWERCGTTDGYL